MNHRQAVLPVRLKWVSVAGLLIICILVSGTSPAPVGSVQVLSSSHSPSLVSEENLGKSHDYNLDGGTKPIPPSGQEENAEYVDGSTGNDENSGTTPAEPFGTIQAALDKAVPGSVIHIAPGVYRESIVPKESGTATDPITLVAANGPGTVFIRGSEPSSSMSWTRLTENNIGLPPEVDPTNIFVTDLSSWGLTSAPRFIVWLDGSETGTRLMPAREPDYRVDTEWKYNEFWWSANGGSSVANCDPTKNVNKDCDLSTRSFTELIDSKDDTLPEGIEPGNLMDFGDLTGGTLVATDAHHALYVYRRTITSTNTAQGKVTVNADCDNDGEPGLGWGSKYYVENAPSLLDQPGEWWFDVSQGKLFIWAPSGANPAELNLEISRLNTGFDFSNISNVILDGLTIELFNSNAYQIVNKSKTSAAVGNQIKNSQIRYADNGIVLYHFVQGVDDSLAIRDFLLENSEVGFMDTTGFDSYFGWYDAPSPALYTYAGIREIIIKNNEFHDIGFNSSQRSAVGIRIFFPDKIRLEGNHIHHIAQNGVHFHLSLIDSERTYDVDPAQIRLGEILVANNLIEKTCQAASDCGGLKFGGSNRPDTHIFRDVLVYGNTLRYIFGYSFVSIQRRINTLGDGNGFYLDYAAGIHVYRNLAYDNSGAGFKLSCLWRDGDAIFYNNVAANNYLYGFKTTGMSSCDNHDGSVNTQFVNNIVMNNGLAGFELLSGYLNKYGNLVLDHNLYFQNGWDDSVGGSGADILLYRDSLPVSKLAGAEDITSKTPWEQNGVFTDPVLLNYNVSDHAEFEYIEHSFEPSSQSFALLDAGTESLPVSLTTLLSFFGVADNKCGSAYEIGRFEIYKTLPAFMPFDSQSEWPDHLIAPICSSSSG